MSDNIYFEKGEFAQTMTTAINRLGLADAGMAKNQVVAPRRDLHFVVGILTSLLYRCGDGWPSMKVEEED